MVPNARVYACVIESLCCSGQLEEAMQRLMEMHEREVEAGMAHVLPIIQAQALDGDMQGRGTLPCLQATQRVAWYFLVWHVLAWHQHAVCPMHVRSGRAARWDGSPVWVRDAGPEGSSGHPQRIPRHHGGVAGCDCARKCFMPRPRILCAT